MVKNMKERMIRLYGAWGFGKVHKMAVEPRSTRALCIVIPGFEKFIILAVNAGLPTRFSGKKILNR
jgi:predicted phage tail protein